MKVIVILQLDKQIEIVLFSWEVIGWYLLDFNGMDKSQGET